ncbi:MAG TPA: alpha/beta fold hydrolase [Ktedonobacterales bacterium]|jgi:dienelactone hydrolase
MEKTYSEELVWIQSEDGIRLNGAVIRPIGPSKPVVVVHVPGWDISFAHPLHLLVSRALAGQGYASVTGNNRGWAFGEIVEQHGGYTVIGAGWERFQDCPLDIGAWVDFALGLGFRGVALLGHSLGSAKIVAYQAQRQHPQVAGLVCASPAPITFPPIAAEVRATAQRLVEQGRGSELLPWGSFGPDGTLSARTLLDWTPEARAALGMFGVTTPEPLIGQIRCPLLLFYGTGGDVGGAQELERIRSQATAASRVDTRLFVGANHPYSGHEQEVGAGIAAWLDTLL